MECLYNPELKDKPVAVCGSQELRHGIVLAKNMHAKKFGIKTGLAVWEAKKLCPDLVVLPARQDLYLRYAKKVRAIYARYTDKIEPFGIDEAWLDVSGEDGPALADELRRIIRYECGITASVGVSDNKIYSKLGSDYKKPDATTVFLGAEGRSVVYDLPVSDLLFVGRATAAKLRNYRINTIGDLARSNPAFLKSILGKNGLMLLAYANGTDDSPVRTFGVEETVKSIGHSTTTPRDMKNEADANLVLTLLSEAVATRLREHGLACRTVVLWLRKSNLESFEKQIPLEFPSDIAAEIRDASLRLFRGCFNEKLYSELGIGIRSLGVRATSLIPKPEFIQTTLTCDFDKRIRLETLERTMDDVRRRFGYFSIRRASMLRDKALTELNPREAHAAYPAAVSLEL